MGNSKTAQFKSVLQLLVAIQVCLFFCKKHHEIYYLMPSMLVGLFISVDLPASIKLLRASWMRWVSSIGSAAGLGAFAVYGQGAIVYHVAILHMRQDDGLNFNRYLNDFQDAPVAMCDRCSAKQCALIFANGFRRSIYQNAMKIVCLSAVSTKAFNKLIIC